MKNIKYIIAFGALALMVYTEKAKAQASNNSNANTMGTTSATTANTIALVNYTQTKPYSLDHLAIFFQKNPLPQGTYINNFSLEEIITQIQSSVLPPQASSQPQVLNLSSTLVVQQTPQLKQQTPLLNTNSGFGTPSPLLQIQNGGMQLPLIATSITE